MSQKLGNRARCLMVKVYSFQAHMIFGRGAVMQPFHTRCDSAWLFGTWLAVAFCALARAETPVGVVLEDIDSGTTSPQGNYRWMDVADQIYAASYQDSYNYTQASVQVDFFTDAVTLHGTLSVVNLKPHFAYQFKLVGNAGTASNESIGFAGRWWQEEWNGSQWANGSNLNNKGDGSWPNPNDLTHCSRRDIPDPSSPTGYHYQYTAYVVFGYFITDEYGDGTLNFTADSSYHVLWKTTQRAHTPGDGPLMNTVFDVTLPDPVGAYLFDYPPADVTIFGEWERLPVGGVLLPAGSYQASFVLTEESFHGSGLAGGWAAAMGAPVTFTLIADPASVFGDFDGDGAVGMSDFEVLTGCMAGPDTPPIAACPRTPQDYINAFDSNADGAVDLRDFAVFQRAFGR
jgi:hypothetical protein